MKPLRRHQRLTCLLLSFCVALASVGTTRAEMACGMVRALVISCEPVAPASPGTCCADPAQQAPPRSEDKSGCCAIKVAYHHVTPEATGAFFKLVPPLEVALPPALFFWPETLAPALAHAPSLRLQATSSSPPGKLVGWALVRALHQLRN